MSTIYKQATQLIRMHITFIEDSGSDAELTNKLKGTRNAMYRPVQRDTSMTGQPMYKNHVGVFYCSNASGESVTNPKTREPPFRIVHYRRLMTTVIKARATLEDENFRGLYASDIYFISNGGKDGLNTQIMSAFQWTGENGETEKIEHKCEPKTIVLDEEAVRARRGKVRGSVKQLEGLLCVSRHGPNFSNKKLHYPGTCAGSLIGPVTLAKLDSDMTCKMKQADKTHLRQEPHRSWRPQRARR